MSPLEQIYRKQRASLMRYIARRTGSPQSAEDIAQEMFLRFLQARQTGDIREPAAYLRVIASHVMYDQQKRRAQEPVIFNSALADTAARFLVEPSHGEPEAGGREPRLHSILRTVPRLHASIVRLRYVAGMSLPEIAYTLDLSEHTVKKYLACALQQCRAKARRL